MKCNYCKKYFKDEREGRKGFYNIKYCSGECAKNGIRVYQSKTRERQTIRMAKKFKELKNKHGKISIRCKNCHKSYETYVSHARARGTSFCSRECKAEYTKSHRSVSVLKKEAWTIFSKYVRARDAIRTTGNILNAKCITCPEIKKIVDMDSGHFQSRTHNIIFLDEHNVHAQCKGCNMPPNSGEQYLYSKQIVVLYGPYELDRLEKARYQTKQFKQTELLLIIEIYRQKLQELINKYGNPWRN